MERWNNRVAFVSGINTEIGTRICRRLVRHGMIVVGCGPVVTQFVECLANEEEYLESPGEFHEMTCNSCREDEIDAMFRRIRARFGRIDVCVNISDFSPCSQFTETESQLRHILQGHFLAMGICSRQSLALMRENNITDGMIIQVVQVHSIIIRGLPGTPLQYFPTPGYHMFEKLKSEVLTYTGSLRRDFQAEGSGIRFACIYPGEEVTHFSHERVLVLQSERVPPMAEVFAHHVIRILETPDDQPVNDVRLMSAYFRAEGGCHS